MTENLTTNNSKPQANKTSNRITAILLVLVFALPLVLAKFALEGDWFNRGATNRGTLLEPPIELESLLKKDKPLWRIVYALPEVCDNRCENALYSVNQVWLASGKEKPRIEPTLIVTESSNPQKLSEITVNAEWLVVNTSDEYLTKVFNKQAVSGIFVADTLGNIILRYPLQNEQQQAVLKSRDILADLKKLLKLSRIG